MEVEEYVTFYEVVRNTPLGDVVMGRFRYKENAEQKCVQWNNEVKNNMDKAWVTKVHFDD